MPSKNVAKKRVARKGNSPRMDRRLARTRETLLSAAQSLFADRAVEAVTIDDIANTADVAKGTFYNHFGDKDAIATEVLFNVRNQVERSIDALNRGVHDASARVANALCLVLGFACSNPESARALLRMRLYPPATGLDSSINAGVRSDIEAGIASGVFDVRSVEIGVTIVLGISDSGIAQVLDHLETSAVAEFARQLAVCLLRALGVRAAQAMSVARQAAARAM